MNISEIKKCKSLDELQSLWVSNTSMLSRLPIDEAKELIKAKDSHKNRLECFEEWRVWYDERAAIGQFDGGLSREEAEAIARESMFHSIVERGQGHE